MTGIFFPVALVVIALFIAFAAYRNIRRGGARFYTLEREAILRRASFMVAASTLLFIAAISLLLLERQQTLDLEAAESGEPIEGVETRTPDPEVLTVPPTPSATATADASIPTPTITPVVCRAVVTGTFDNGLMMRDAPGGAEVTILAEASLVQLIPGEEIVEANGFSWRKVRSIITNDEGWVAEEYLELGPGCE
jgi:hypothetical protein